MFEVNIWISNSFVFSANDFPTLLLLIWQEMLAKDDKVNFGWNSSDVEEAGE